MTAARMGKPRRVSQLALSLEECQRGSHLAKT